MIVCDLEIYLNYFLAGFEMPSGEIFQYRFIGDQYTHNMYEDLNRFVSQYKDCGYSLGTFNGRGYDDLILTNFLKNPSTQAAWLMSQQIIVERVPYWRFDNQIKSVDLMQILPGRIGLKKCAVCLGHPTLRELPFDPQRPLEPWQMEELDKYNINDLHITRRLVNENSQELELRQMMSEKYDMDLRSMGRATVAEKILFHELQGIDPQADWKTLKNNSKNRYPTGSTIRCDAPNWWHLIPTLLDQYPMVLDVRYLAEKIFHKDIRILDGYMEKGSLDSELFLNDVWYSLGVGGLHSVDGSGHWVSGNGKKLITADVTGYYPNLMLTQQLAPHYWGESFLSILSVMVGERQKAKGSDDPLAKKLSDVLKIATNGSYGKTASPGSIVYDPYVTANVTVRGQLALLVLIAMLGSHGHRVVSANTDGIEIYCDENLYQSSVVPIIQHWEQFTGLNMEYSENRALYQTDVNNYIMVKQDGSLKCKGAKFYIPAEGKYDLEHTPMHQIVSRAVQKYLQNGTPIQDTILACQDLQEFVLTQQVADGWKVHWHGQEVNKMVRFYKSTSPEAQPIMRVPQGPTGNEGKVASSDNCMLAIDFPEQFPTDIDYQWYVTKAEELLSEILNTKKQYMNTLARSLISRGIIPALIDLDKERLSRANPVVGQIDFNSITSNQSIGVATGKRYRLMAVRNPNGETTHIIHTKRNYPTKTRATIMKKHGFELIYSGNVPINPWAVQIKLETAEVNLDKYYTETELRRARANV